MATRLRIDLLPKEAEVVRKSNILVANLQLATRIIAVILLLVTGTIFGLLFYSNFQLARASDQVAGLQLQIEQSSEAEVRYRLYQEILTKASEVVGQRRDYRGIFADLYALVPPGVAVAGVGFETETVSFDGEAAGVQAFGRALDSFKQIGQGAAGRFSRVILGTVSRGLDAVYKFKMEISLARQ